MMVANLMMHMEVAGTVLNGVKLGILSDVDIIQILDLYSLRKTGKILALHSPELDMCGIRLLAQTVHVNWRSISEMESDHSDIMKHEDLGLLDLLDLRDLLIKQSINYNYYYNCLIIRFFVI